MAVLYFLGFQAKYKLEVSLLLICMKYPLLSCGSPCAYIFKYSIIIIKNIPTRLKRTIHICGRIPGDLVKYRANLWYKTTPENISDYYEMLLKAVPFVVELHDNYYKRKRSWKKLRNKLLNHTETLDWLSMDAKLLWAWIPKLISRKPHPFGGRCLIKLNFKRFHSTERLNIWGSWFVVDYHRWLISFCESWWHFWIKISLEDALSTDVWVNLIENAESISFWVGHWHSRVAAKLSFPSFNHLV